jgi:outer membrane protein TolC
MNLFLSFALAAGLYSAGSLVAAQSASPPATLPHYKSDHPHLTLKDWRAANEEVDRAGGWKAYAREADAAEKERKAAGAQQPDQRTPLTLNAAIDIALRAEPELMQSLAGLHLADLDSAARNLIAPDLSGSDYLRLSPAQRSALTRRAHLIADVSRHYFAAVAASERLSYQHQVTEAMAIAAELAGRMRSVGNLNAIHQTEEQLTYAKTVRDLVRAEQAALSARERLIRRLNLSGAAASFSLPPTLPELPAAPRALTPLEQRLMAEAVTASATASRSETVTAAERLPASVSLRSEVREAYSQYRRAYDLARHQRDEVLPLQRRISDEQLLRYNGMLIGVFELLADAKDQVKAVEGYLDALHAFWNADAELTPKLAALKDHMSSFRRSAWTQ